jgi:hypothetical protein
VRHYLRQITLLSESKGEALIDPGWHDSKEALKIHIQGSDPSVHLVDMLPIDSILCHQVVNVVGEAIAWKYGWGHVS